MTGTDLVPLGGEIAQGQKREESLRRLVEVAETVDSAADARAVMIQASAVADVLKQAREPFEHAWLAGKASVIAARKLGRILDATSAEVRYGYGSKRGAGPSDRGILRRELGLSIPLTTALLRLGRAADPDFQRYIQSKDRIPSLTGAIRVCRPDITNYNTKERQAKYGQRGINGARRRRVGVKTPKNPSLDEAYSLIVRALGHLGSNVVGKPAPGSTVTKRSAEIARAIDYLYAAEDLLKPYRGGYVE